jgi:hypothetical protein
MGYKRPLMERTTLLSQELHTHKDERLKDGITNEIRHISRGDDVTRSINNYVSEEYIPMTTSLFPITTCVTAFQTIFITWKQLLITWNIC